MVRPLTPKQALFVEEYLKDFNASQAVLRAGYKTKNPDAFGSQLLSKTQSIVEQRKAELMAAKKLTLEQWVEKVTQLAFYDPRKLFDHHGNPIEIPELGDTEAACIAGFEIVEDFTKVKKAGGGEDAIPTGYTKKVKLLDRTPYIMALGKYLGAFPEKRGKDPGSIPQGRYDLTQLSPQELEEFKRLREKARIKMIEGHVSGT